MGTGFVIICCMLFVGAFLLYQDFIEEMPPWSFSFTPLFYAGVSIIVGTIGFAIAVRVRNARSKT